MWKGGSELQVMTPLPEDPLDPLDPVDPLDCSKLVFYLSETLLSPYLAAPGGQIGFSYVSPQSTCSKWRDTRVDYHTWVVRHFEQVDCLQNIKTSPVGPCCIILYIHPSDILRNPPWSAQTLKFH